MNTLLHEPICQQVAWKNDEMKRFALALVRRALAAGGEFTTDIVPDDERGTGTGIAGSVIELLKNASVLEPVGVTQNGEWYAKRLISARPGCKSRYVGVYRLRDRGTARSFLTRNGEALEYQEQDFFN